jgi:hypothetical protein
MSITRWKRPVDGNFATGSHWRGGDPPQVDDRAELTAQGAAYEVKVTQTARVKSIELLSNATLAILGEGNQIVSLTVSDGTGPDGANAGAIEVRGRAIFAVAGAFDNIGSIALDSLAGDRLYRGATRLEIKKDTTLTGGGVITLAGNSMIRGHGVTLVNVDNTISGQGTIGEMFEVRQGLDIVNGAAGVIDSTGGGLSIGGLLNGSFSSLKNDGLIESTGGSLEIANTTLSGTGTILAGGNKDVGVGGCFVTGQALIADAGGSFQFEGGRAQLRSLMIGAGSSCYVLSNEITVTGAFSNNGQLFVNYGSTFTADQPVTGAGSVEISQGSVDFAAEFIQDVKFDVPQGSGQTLELGRSQTYAGSITGLTVATTLALDDIGFVSAGEATFSGTGSSGVLTVTDGSETARINLIGDYSTSTFVASSNGHGGVLIVEAAAQNNARLHAFNTAVASLADHGADSRLVLGQLRGGAQPTLVAPRATLFE